MSRGWESKSVEEQQMLATAQEHATAKSTARSANLEDQDRKRQRQTLEMQRERILSERTASPHRRSALGAALADIEEKLTELGWSLHL